MMSAEVLDAAGPARSAMRLARSEIPMPVASDDQAAALILALMREVHDLRRQLGTAQDRLVEAAIEAGELHARIEALGAELAETRAGRNAWRAEAEQLVERANRRA